jgi:subfamily B ATP-binding cassette protein MsbA
LKQARWHLVGGLFSGVVFAVCTGAGLPAVMKYLLPIFFDQKDDINPHVVGFARTLFGEGYRDGLMVLACVGLPLMFLIRGLASFANRYLVNQAGFIVLESLRLEAYARLLSLPLAFYQRNKAGDLSARLMNDTDKIKAVIVNVSSDIVTQPLTLLSALGYLVYLSYTNHSALFAMVAMISVPLCVVPIRMTARRLKKRSRQLAEKGGELNSSAIETLQSPLEIQAYNLQGRQRERFITQIREIFSLSMKTIKYQAVVTPAIEVISVCGFVAALYFGTKNGMTFNVFVSLATALFFAYGPVKKLSGVQALIKTGEASLDRLEYILDAKDTVPQSAAPRTLPKGPLEFVFENVSFAYEQRPGQSASTSGPVEALRDITLRAKPGETIALVGASGAGKSTFITLLPRFYDPTGGRIALGGIDLREIDKSELRDRIAVVPQQPLLFNASLAENIRLGRAGATDEEVVQAARRANVHDFIASLPQGYATMVGERGNSLSGGQRQRIAIARAFLKDAPILVLDEATSALDSESEAMVQAALKELVQGRTTFMIAHRFSSIRDATRILVFEQGRITGDGPHATLHATSTLYRDLYDHQYTQQ